MKVVKAALGTLLGIAFAVIISGCGGSENAEVFPAQGLVTFNGKPMSGGGAISLIPVTSQHGKNAGGIINSDGTFVLTTYVEGDGAMAGSFRVIINQTTSQEPDYGGDSDAAGAATAKEVKTVTSSDVIPTIYSDPVSSPIEIRIEAKEMNELTINLERNVPGGFVPGA
jgi:hypothetical protein